MRHGAMAWLIPRRTLGNVIWTVLASGPARKLKPNLEEEKFPATLLLFFALRVPDRSRTILHEIAETGSFPSDEAIDSSQ